MYDCRKARNLRAKNKVRADLMKHLACALVALIVALRATTATAGPDQVSVMLGSHHVGASGFEEVNPGLFLTWTGAAFSGRADLSVGGYRNSYGDGSLAASVALPLVRRAAWDIALFGALAWYPGNGHRFEVSAGDLVPVAGLQSRAGPAFVQVIPGGGRSVDATVTFGLTFALTDRGRR